MNVRNESISPAMQEERMGDKRTRTLAKNMRKRMTKYEYRLYAGFLSTLPMTVCRQKVIGDYIVDFLLPAEKLIIEVDGSQHFTPDGFEKDAARDTVLREQGYTVLRYSNSDVYQNLEGVAEDILNRLEILRNQTEEPPGE